jgi:hypothetical protein
MGLPSLYETIWAFSIYFFQILTKIVRFQSLWLHDKATWHNQGLKQENLPSMLEQIFSFKTSGLSKINFILDNNFW